MVSAAIAETISVAFRTPFEVLKQNRQYMEFKKTSKAMSTIWKQRGIRGFYAGFGATLWREIPFSILELGLYELLIKHPL